jgi:branched-chain amino acid transport system ATP-binding protein
MSELQIDDLTVGYLGDIQVLRGVSLRAAEGRITAILGANGVGKSTLLKTVYGYMKPWSGDIFLASKTIVGRQPHELLALGIGYIPQERTVFPELTVHENLEIGAWLLRRQSRNIREAIGRVYQRFPILEAKKRDNGKTLSGGQQRMLELGRALLTLPQVLLIDEPTVGLAPTVASEIYALIKDLSRSGMTILLVDQNVEQAMKTSDDVYVLEMGVVKDHGSGEKFLSSSEATVEQKEAS